MLGGITVQLSYGVTAFTLNSLEGTAFRIHPLLDNPERASKVGQNTRKAVRRDFLITRPLGDDWVLMSYAGR